MICGVQVPRSSKLIFEDNDYSLYSVTLFKRVADSFKAAARSKGFQVTICPDNEASHPIPLIHTYMLGDNCAQSSREWAAAGS